MILFTVGTSLLHRLYMPKELFRFMTSWVLMFGYLFLIISIAHIPMCKFPRYVSIAHLGIS